MIAIKSETSFADNVELAASRTAWEFAMRRNLLYPTGPISTAGFRVATKLSGALDWAQRPLSRRINHTLDVESAAALIRALLDHPRAHLVARMGSCEQSVLRRYILWNKLPLLPNHACDNAWFGPALRAEIEVKAGFFPTSQSQMNEFSKQYLRALADVDILAIWHNRGDRAIVKSCPPDATIAPLVSLRAFSSERPWTHGLAGRSVVVVHPFKEILEEQAGRLSAIWPNGEIPAADYRFVRAPMTLGGSASWSSWFEALEAAKESLKETEGQVVLIAAGSYGLPLASYAKELGRTAILVGGILQLFFGVIGSRWEGNPVFSKHFNDAWVRPSSEYQPRLAKLVDGRAYW